MRVFRPTPDPEVLNKGLRTGQRTEDRCAMRPNPAQDILVFLTKPAWPTGLFWLLLLGSVAVAIVVAARQPSLRTPA